MSRRRALRDFYKLQAEAEAAAAAAAQETLEIDDAESSSLLDGDDFDIDSYTAQILATQGVLGLVKVHNDLVLQAKALDSDQKALVYNNYKKLIRASDTLGYLNGQGALAGLEALESTVNEIKKTVETAKAPGGIDPAAARNKFIESRRVYQETYQSSS